MIIDTVASLATYELLVLRATPPLEPDAPLTRATAGHATCVCQVR